MWAIDQHTQELQASINKYNQRASEAAEQKSAVDLPFLTLITIMRVFMNNRFNRKIIHFYRQLERGLPVSRRIKKCREA